jgi:hypothetical protein
MPSATVATRVVAQQAQFVRGAGSLAAVRALPPVLARFSPLAARGDRERTPIEALTR